MPLRLQGGKRLLLFPVAGCLTIPLTLPTPFVKPHHWLANNAQPLTTLYPAFWCLALTLKITPLFGTAPHRFYTCGVQQGAFRGRGTWSSPSLLFVFQGLHDSLSPCSGVQPSAFFWHSQDCPRCFQVLGYNNPRLFPSFPGPRSVSCFFIVTFLCYLTESFHIFRSLALFSWEGDGNPLQYSCLENPMDGGAYDGWWATVHGVAKSQTRLSDFTFIHSFIKHRKSIVLNIFFPS